MADEHVRRVSMPPALAAVSIEKTTRAWERLEPRTQLSYAAWILGARQPKAQKQRVSTILKLLESPPRARGPRSPAA